MMFKGTPLVVGGGEDEEPESLRFFGEVIVGDPARQVDAGGDTPSCREASIDSFELPVPADEHLEILLVAEDGREGLGRSAGRLSPRSTGQCGQRRERDREVE